MANVAIDFGATIGAKVGSGRARVKSVWRDPGVVVMSWRGSLVVSSYACLMAAAGRRAGFGSAVGT